MGYSTIIHHIVHELKTVTIIDQTAVGTYTTSLQTMQFI